MSRVVPTVLGLLLAVLLSPPAAVARGSIGDIEKEFRKAIEVATPATVSCVAWGVPDEEANTSSGVIVSASGFVLSDGDVGAVRVRREAGATSSDGEDKEPRGKWRVEFRDRVEIRVPDLAEGGFAAYPARVVRRVRGMDTCLLKIEEPPPGGFDAFVPAWTSADVRVGDFSFVVGNAFGLSKEAPPALTAGIVAHLRPLPPDDGGGDSEFIYTSAAVNPGVNGGPAVDVEGRLIGTVSTWLQPAPDEPYQFLGKIVPIDRIRAAYSDLPEAAEAFPEPEAGRTRAEGASALARVFRHLATEAGPSVVSLEVDRTTPLSSKAVGGGGLHDVGRWRGPVSGVLLDAEGWIVTSLYNLTNITELVAAGAKLPPEIQLETGLRAIQGVEARLPGGLSAPARLVAHDGRLGIALLKADLEGLGGATTPGALPTIPKAGDEAFEPGRFALALGNPFGARRDLGPLLSFGVLSKVHAEDVPAAWRGQWQTDAGLTDANCGGALVDLRGRLLGILHIWAPLMHGRNSGIGFVVPWPRIAAALPALKRGESLRRGLMGVQLEEGQGAVRIKEVTAASPAAVAGVRPGDAIVSIDGRPVESLGSLQRLLAYRWAGEVVALGLSRDGDREDVEVTLAPRP